jgi:hypothetical protein
MKVTNVVSHSLIIVWRFDSELEEIGARIKRFVTVGNLMASVSAGFPSGHHRKQKGIPSDKGWLKPGKHPSERSLIRRPGR